MNKLYVINFTLSNGYIVSTWTAWRKKDLIEKMDKNPEWDFKLKENNGIHEIWEAR